MFKLLSAAGDTQKFVMSDYLTVEAKNPPVWYNGTMTPVSGSITGEYPALATGPWQGYSLLFTGSTGSESVSCTVWC